LGGDKSLQNHSEKQPAVEQINECEAKLLLSKNIKNAHF
jgi:hypothetical protein